MKKVIEAAPKHCFLCGAAVKRLQRCGLCVCEKCCRECKEAEPGRCLWEKKHKKKCLFRGRRKGQRK